MESKHSQLWQPWQPWHVAYPKYEERMKVISKAVAIWLANPELLEFKLVPKN